MTSTSTINGIHEHAECYPLLADDDLAALAEDIRENGQRDPVTVTSDGLLIDGRNRARACAMLGIEPLVEVYEGDDIGAFVRSRNMRRHQPVGSLAMSTALSLQADGLRENGRWKRGSVDISASGNSESQWRQRLAEAGVVLDYAPDNAAPVVSGAVALRSAFEQADRIRKSAEAEKIRERELKKREREEAKEQAERNAQIVADLTQADQGQYVDLIDSGAMTPASAWAAYMEDTRKEREKKAQEKRNAEQAAGGVARSVMALHALTDPVVLDRFLTVEWPLGHAGASPAARDRMTPQHFRDIADALNQLADSWKGAPNA